ncbi:MAG: DNA mismatch repair protein MutS, partial [Paeniclostridium sp.]
MDEIFKGLIAVGVILLVGILFSIYENRKRIKYLKLNIVSQYGKEIDLEDVNLKMKNVSSYFKNKNENKTIDDITWNDLSLDDVFKKINNTQSTAGQEVLYDILRNPLHNKDELSRRDNIIEFFRNNEKERQNIQLILGKLGKTDELYITNCLFNKSDNSKSKLLIYRILAWLPTISLIFLFINPLFIVLTIGVVTLNVFISQRNKIENYDASGFSYMIKLINVANKIKENKIKELDENMKNIDLNLKNLNNIRRKNISTEQKSIMSDLDVFSEYANLAFLRELITYEKIKNTIIRNKEDLKEIYEYIGKIDALIAVASFRDSLEFYSKPILTKSNSKIDNHISFKDIYHPLIKKPVLNSRNFYKGVLLTGSNASGKSTFIKTIAINAILAQTIYTCLAYEYKSSYFNIYTSMALKDDIHNSESYYIVEIKSLKRILDSINDENKVIKIDNVDEVYLEDVDRINFSHSAYVRISEGCDNFCTYC